MTFAPNCLAYSLSNDHRLVQLPCAGGIAAAAVGNYICGAQCGAELAAYYSAGSAYYQTGDVGTAVKAGVTSYASAQFFIAAGQATGSMGNTFWGGVAKIGAHAVAGCASAAMGGGDCGQGALSAAVAKGVTIGLDIHYKGLGVQKIPFEVGFTAAIVSGGIAEQMGGGKFANGAVTGAFGYLFNYESSRVLRTVVPGQVSFDAGMTAIEQGQYGSAIAHFAAMLGEQVLTIATFGEYSAVGSAARIEAQEQGLRAAATKLEIGANPNQVSHSFRHIENLGLTRDAVTTAIRTDMSGVSLQVGQGVTRSVTVDGVVLSYRAHRYSESAINIGRITGPKP